MKTNQELIEEIWEDIVHITFNVWLPNQKDQELLKIKLKLTDLYDRV